MQCLYCGKGIGPIRQLRDREFCSEPHRVQFRERYRQSLYEALSAEAAPVRMADFIERPPAHHDPAPSAVLRLLRKSLSGVRELALDIDRAGMSAAQPAWIFGQNLAAIGAQLVWQGSAAAYPLPAIQPGFPVVASLVPQGMSPPDSGNSSPFSSANIFSPRPIWRRFELQLVVHAFCLADESAGSSSAARMAMMAMTTSSSISVNPAREEATGFRKRNFPRLFMFHDLTVKTSRTQSGNVFAES